MSLPNTPNNDIRKPSVDNQNTPPPQQPVNGLNADAKKIADSMNDWDFFGLTEELDHPNNKTDNDSDALVELVVNTSREEFLGVADQKNHVDVPPEKEQRIRDLCSCFFEEAINSLTAQMEKKHVRAILARFQVFGMSDEGDTKEGKRELMEKLRKLHEEHAESHSKEKKEMALGKEAIKRFRDYLSDPDGYTLEDLFDEWRLFENILSYFSQTADFSVFSDDSDAMEVKGFFASLGLTNEHTDIHPVSHEPSDAENDKNQTDVSAVQEDQITKQSRELLQGILSAFADAFGRRHTITMKRVNLEIMGMNFETRAARIELLDILENMPKGNPQKDYMEHVLELETSIRKVEDMYGTSPVRESDEEFSERIQSMLEEGGKKLLKARIADLKKSIEEGKNYAKDKMERIVTLQKTLEMLSEAKDSYSVYAEELKEPVDREYLLARLRGLRDFKAYVAGAQNEIIAYEKMLKTNNLPADKKKEIVQYVTERKLCFDVFVRFFEEQDRAIWKICTLLDQELL